MPFASVDYFNFGKLSFVVLDIFVCKNYMFSAFAYF